MEVDEMVARARVCWGIQVKDVVQWLLDGGLWSFPYVPALEWYPILPKEQLVAMVLPVRLEVPT